MRRNFDTPIRTISRTDIPQLRAESTLGCLLHTAWEHDWQMLPVCDQEGRITGYADQRDLLDGLLKAVDLDTEPPSTHEPA